MQQVYVLSAFRSCLPSCPATACHSARYELRFPKWKLVSISFNPPLISIKSKYQPENMVLFGLRNLGCAFLRPCHFSLLRILGWRNSKRCERQRFGVMAVCCGADMLATKVGEAKPVIMQRLVEEIPVVGLNAWCLGTLVLGCLTKTSHKNAKIIGSNSKISVSSTFFKGSQSPKWRMKEETRGKDVLLEFFFKL